MSKTLPVKFKIGEKVLISKWERMPIFPFRVVRFKGKIVPDSLGNEVYSVQHTGYQIHGSRKWKPVDYPYVSIRCPDELKKSKRMKPISTPGLKKG